MDKNYSNLLERIESIEKRLASIEGNVSSVKQAPSTKKKTSMREFLNSKKPTTANNRALCIAYYLETVQASTSFNADDIKMGFREARITLPKNPNDIINQNIAKGFIMDADEQKDGKKAWVLTGTGLDIVEKGFEKKS